MAVGLGSTVEELVKEINSKDVTSASNNKFTGNNTFTKGIAVYGSNSPPLPNTLYKVDKDGFVVITGSGLFNYNKVKFKLDPTATTAKEYTIATNEDLDKKQPLLVSGENIKTINGQSILGSGDLEISGGGSGGSGAGTYAHLVSFGLYRSDDNDVAGWGSIMIPSSSANVIVGTSADNLKTFLAKFNGKFYPMAMKTDGYTVTPYTGIFVNPTDNLLKVVASNTSGGNAEFAIDVYDVTETVVQTSTGGSGGGGGSSDYGGVIISVASTNSYRIDPQDQLSQHNIRVRIVSGTLQVGDRLEICRPIAKKAYNRVNGMQTNIRYRQKLKACAHKILTETDIANIAAGKNILVLTVNHSSDQPNKGFKYSCTRSGSSRAAPRTVRITRPMTIGQTRNQYIQISNSVYLTRNFDSCVIKGM